MQKSRLFQVLVKFGFPKLVVLKSFTKRKWAALFVEQYTHQKNVNENLIFKQSLRGTAYC